MHLVSGYQLAPRWRISVEALLVPAIILVALFFYSTEFLELVLRAINLGAVTQILFLGTYALFLVLTLRRWPMVARASVRVPTMIALIALVPISTLWSVNPSETVERSVALVGSTLAAIYMGSTLSIRQIVLLFGLAVTAAAIGSLVFAVAIPSLGVTPHSEAAWGGTWRGLYLHKNGLGAAMAFAALVCLIARAQAAGLTKTILTVGLLVSLFMLFKSESRTSQGLFLVCAAIAVLGMLDRRALQVWAVSLVGFGLIGFAGLYILLATGIIEEILTSLGRDITLSNRIPIWTYTWDKFISKAFFLGWGYEAFWDKDTLRLRIFDSLLNFMPAYSHNGVLEVWLGLGVVGVSLLGLTILAYMRSAAIYIVRFPDDPNIVAITTLFVFVLLSNFMEGQFLARNNAIWILYVTLLIAVTRFAYQQRVRGPTERNGHA
ncbi:MAG: O-antigen ligase family protein [Pseudomonadota bacterium]